ncbi:MAG: hypothetical protein JOZ22_11405, partial [Acidobacteriia bacterium]|nr:hypothetical protein [Terriglobia bacterium]
HGWLAAPIVKDVLAAYFDKKKRFAEQAAAQKQNLTAKMASLGNMILPQAAVPNRAATVRERSDSPVPGPQSSEE